MGSGSWGTKGDLGTCVYVEHPYLIRTANGHPSPQPDPQFTDLVRPPIQITNGFRSRLHARYESPMLAK